MKLRGFLVILILAAVIIYFVYFLNPEKKQGLQTKVESFVSTKVNLTRANMKTLSRSIDQYIIDSGSAPKNLDEVSSVMPIMNARFDAWGKRIRYKRISDISFRLISAGVDKKFGTDDDIVVDN